MYYNSSGPRLMLPAAAREKEMSEVVIASSPGLLAPLPISQTGRLRLLVE
jgi:hypothetical protein